MSGFAIKYPFFIIMICLIIARGRRDHGGAHAGGPVSQYQYSGGGGGDVLFGDAAGTN